MPYDHKKFALQQISRRGGKTYSVPHNEKTPLHNDVRTGDPYIDLAFAVILQAVKDYRLAKRHKVRAEWIANLKEMGYEDAPALEVFDFFAGDEFKFHCAICGLEPDVLCRRFRVV